MAFIARITEHGRPQWKFHWALQGKMANILHIIWFFLYHPKSCWKHKVLEKRLVNLSIENKIGLFFSLPNLTPFSEIFMMYDGPQGIFPINLPAIRSFFGTKEVVTTKFSQIKGYHPVGKKFLHKFLSFLPIRANIEQQFVRLFKIMWHLWCKLWDYFSTPNRLLKTKFSQEKRLFCNENVFWIIFSCIIEFKKPQEPTYNVLKGFLTIIFKVIRSLSRTKEVEKKLFQKTAVFPMRKKTWQILFRLTEYGRFQKKTFY